MTNSSKRSLRHTQNFLYDSRLIERLVRQSSIGAGDLVLEIGPGDGAITQQLVTACDHVLAVELDARYVARLNNRFTGVRNLTLFHGDFLAFPLPHSPYKVFSSIPYDATAAIVGKLTTGLAPPEDAYLVVQLEAADRFIGSPRTTLASARIAPWFDMAIATELRRTDFRPVPSVESVLLRLERRVIPFVAVDRRSRYDDLVSALFTAWQPSVRKAVEHILPGRTAALITRAFRERLDDRPGDTPHDIWIEMFRLLDEHAEPRVWRALAEAASVRRNSEARIKKPTRTSSRRSHRRA